MEQKLGQPPIRAFVATPAYDGKVDSDFAMSIAEATMVAQALGIPVQCAFMRNGAFIELARNTFCQLFLDSDATHLFFIDSDLRFEARAFVSLLQAGRPVCAGVYRRRQEPEDYPVRYIEAPEGGIQTYDGGWVACDRVPTGFLCIERSVIEKMAEKAPVLNLTNQPPCPQLFYTKRLEDGRFMGEDYCFCEDYREQFGEDIHVWPDFDFTHGGYECNWHNFMNEQVEAFEANQAGEQAYG